jgi:hypothetical protein
LVEIMSRPGRVEGDAGARTWTTPEGNRSTDDNPVLLANHKAKVLKGLLLARPVPKAVRVPFLEPVIVRSDPGLGFQLTPLGARDGIRAGDDFQGEVIDDGPGYRGGQTGWSRDSKPNRVLAIRARRSPDRRAGKGPGPGLGSSFPLALKTFSMIAQRERPRSSRRSRWSWSAPRPGSDGPGRSLGGRAGLVARLSTTVVVTEAAEAVRLFNLRFGEMEKVAWCLSRASRPELLAKAPGAVLPELVWKVRSWMGRQGVEAAVKTIAPQALVEFDWTPDLFDDRSFAQATEKFATDIVSKLTSRMVELGARRNEFSLASKILHWIAPARVPVYDSYVRELLGIPGSYKPGEAYEKLVEWEFEAARPLMNSDTSWVGNIGPRSLLHALDKYLWWMGGGAEGHAVVVNDPWEVIRRLGIDCSKFD